ncbi:DUF4214 domain-containing protein [Pseudomonas sp. DSP3-2-2]|uniref:DUF4214 domain-containing protein n=1 Tax=unclassified Pseudomonas TaxID=196821 RepID=UPI003CF9904C
MAASTYFAQVQQLYIAYFGRPADTIGLNFWATQIDAANGSIAAVQAGFSASTESQALFGNKSTIDKVTAIYQNAFGRAPEPAGLAFWVAQLDSGKVTQAQASWTIQQSAGAGDAAVVQAKLVAAQAFTAQIDTTAEIVGYQGTGAADAGRAFLATVVSAATGATAVTNAPSALATAVAAGGTGSSFSLTAGVDTLTGTSGNDIFTADNTQTAKTLGAADTINGGAGVDTLRVFLAAGDSSFTNPTLNNVENVTINGGIVTAYTAAAGTTGLTIEAPVALGATYTVAGQAVTLKGSALAGTTTIASTADTAANVTLNSWTGSTVDLAGTKVATATLTVTGANSSITLTDTGLALKTLNITGDRGLTVVTPAGLTSVNASTATGAVSVDGSANAAVAAFAFTGGAANDTLTLRAGDLGVLTAGTQLNGGAGTDTLVIKDAALVTADYTKLNAVTGFEVLGLGVTNTTVDAAQLTAIKSFSVGLTGDTISNLGAGTSVAVTANVAALTLGAALGNTATEIAVGTATTAGTAVTSLTTSGLTTLGLTSNGTAANTVGLNNSDNTTVTVKGATDLTLTLAAGTTTGSKVDASAFTGKLSVTGSTLADVIIGGTGADKVTLSTGADTITLGAGADTVVGPAFVQSSATSMTTITDFVAGTDKIDLSAFSNGTGVFTATAVNVTAATTLAQALDLAATGDGSLATGAGQVKYFQFQSNTYVVGDNTAGATFTAATDTVIKLAGLVTLTATDVIA